MHFILLRKFFKPIRIFLFYDRFTQYERKDRYKDEQLITIIFTLLKFALSPVELEASIYTSLKTLGVTSFVDIVF